MVDIPSRVSFKIRKYRLMLLSGFSTFIMKSCLKLKKIPFGEGIRFWGTTYVSKYPLSTITIGKFSSFRSDRTSNLIGVNRKCIISTHSETARISIGNNCGFSGTSIGAIQSIVIGDNVLCGANSLITDFDWHDIHPERRLVSRGISKEVIIGNNVFIGYGAVILKGVTIGENSVIGANSVVSRSIPANVIAGGNPCKVIKDL